MHVSFLVALIIAIPVIMLPAAIIWFLNIGGIYPAIKAAWARRGVRREAEEVEVVAE